MNTESLEKCINYFVTMHPLLLLASGEVKIHQSHLVSDLGKALQAACDSIRTDAAIVQALMKVFICPVCFRTGCKLMPYGPIVEQY